MIDRRRYNNALLDDITVICSLEVRIDRNRKKRGCFFDTFWCQLPNPKGLGRLVALSTYRDMRLLWVHDAYSRNMTRTIQFREYSSRFQGARFIYALEGRRVLYPLTPRKLKKLPPHIIGTLLFNQVQYSTDRRYLYCLLISSEPCSSIQCPCCEETLEEELPPHIIGTLLFNFTQYYRIPI